VYKPTPKFFIVQISIIYLLLSTGWVSAARAQASHELSINWVSPYTGVKFCFRMGTEKGFKFESPVHKVCVDTFYLGEFEVTQEQWDKFMPKNFSKFTGQSRPVERVSWNDAKSFIKKLNVFENTNKYRLPSEAEWEYAARGRTTTQFYWGEDINNSYVWYFGTSNYRTQPVGLKKPNPFGLHDILGNVWEWVEDWFASDYYTKSPVQNPTGPTTGRFKVKRGGSQANLVSHIKSHTRYRAQPDKRHHINGFRIAFTPDKP